MTQDELDAIRKRTDSWTYGPRIVNDNEVMFYTGVAELKHLAAYMNQLRTDIHALLAEVERLREEYAQFKDDASDAYATLDIEKDELLRRLNVERMWLRAIVNEFAKALGYASDIPNTTASELALTRLVPTIKRIMSVNWRLQADNGMLRDACRLALEHNRQRNDTEAKVYEALNEALGAAAQ